MAKAKVQMKEILSQFVDVLIEEELEALRAELAKFRSEIQNELGKFKKSISDDIESFKKSSSKDLIKIKETVALVKTELTSAKSAQSKQYEEFSTKLMNTLEERESVMETNLENLATQVGDTLHEQTEDFNLALKELSKRVENAEKISHLLNNFASGINSAVAANEPSSSAPVSIEKKTVSVPQKKKFETKPAVKKENTAPKAAAKPAPVEKDVKNTAPAAKAPELVVEDAFLDEKLAMDIDSAQIIPPLPTDIEGHKVNPIKVDEVSGQQLYVP